MDAKHVSLQYSKSPIMKHLFLFALLLLNLKGIAQIEICQATVKKTVDAINQGSSAPLEGHLSENFTIAGQEGEIAKMVLQQLLSQLNETVVNCEEKSQQEQDGAWTLVYQMEYAQMGIEEGKFVFDIDNKLEELELFKMEVKTMHGQKEIQSTEETVVRVPFKMAGNLIAVPVTINGEEKMFLLDSGAPVVVLNSKYLPKREDGSRALANTQGVNGQISGMDIHQIESLEFGGLRMENEDLLSMELGHLEDQLDFEIHGLIGYELIKSHDLLFDYDNQTLTLLDPAHLDQYTDNFLHKQNIDKVDFELQGHIPVFKGQVAGKSYTFGLDCGAESNLMESKLHQELQSSLRRSSEDELVGADNHPVMVQKGELKKLSLGNTTFKNSPTMFNDMSHLNDGYHLSLDGLLGYPVLSGQQTLLSYSRNELWLID